MTMQKPIEQWRMDLQATADYIKEHGWCQWTWSMDDGSVCLSTAIQRVTGGSSDWSLPPGSEERRRAVRFHLHTYLMNRGISMHILDFNDDPMRTKEEVIKALEECAGIEEVVLCL